jgi:predicted  nucleic acid-binding Zn-ribbon protein
VNAPSRARSDLVRCLDCGTVYRQPFEEDTAEPCPECGYVGWIKLSEQDEAEQQEDPEAR